MKLNLIETKDILDFEKEIKHELVVNERSLDILSKIKLKKYYAAFEHAEIVDGGVLIGAYGDGDTIDEAISNYCLEVSNKRIRFTGSNIIREEIVFPTLVHGKLLNK